MSKQNTFTLTTRRCRWIVIALAIGVLINGIFAVASVWSIFSGGDFHMGIGTLSIMNLALISNLTVLMNVSPSTVLKETNSPQSA